MMKRHLVPTALMLACLLSFFAAPRSSAYQWTASTGMDTGRNQFAAGVVGTKIYVFGGNGNGDGTNLSSVEVFDTSTQTWSARDAHADFAMEEVTGAAIGTTWYVFGGWGNAINPPGSSAVQNFNYAYNTSTSTWTALPARPHLASVPPTAAYNSKVYLFGGDNGGIISNVDVYDPAGRGAWTSEVTTLPPGNEVVCPAVAVVGTGAFLIGGGNAQGNLTGMVLRYDFGGNSWDTGSYNPLPEPRAFPLGHAVPVINGRIYCIGGETRSGDSEAPSKRVDIFDPAANSWTRGPDLPAATSNGVVVAVNDVIYLIGGVTDPANDKDTQTNAVWKWNVSSGITWVRIMRAQGRIPEYPAGNMYGADIEVEAPSGQSVTMQLPGGTVVDLNAHDGGPNQEADGGTGASGSYRWEAHPLTSLDDYPPGSYTFTLYGGPNKTGGVTQTLDVSFPDQSDSRDDGKAAFDFPDDWPKLASPPHEDDLIVSAPNNHTYRWLPYAGSADATQVEFGIFKEGQDDVAWVVAPINTYKYKPETLVPADTYELQLGFANARTEDLFDAPEIAFSNTLITMYDLTVTADSGELMEDVLDQLLEQLAALEGGWTSLPDDAPSPNISDSGDGAVDSLNAFSPAITTYGKTTYVAWSQTVPDNSGGTQRDIFLRSYDTDHPENGWTDLDGSMTFVGNATGGGISRTESADSVAPRLIVQTEGVPSSPRLWVVWQEGQVNDILEDILAALDGASFSGGVNEMLDFFIDLYTSLTGSEDGTISFGATTIRAKYMELGGGGSWSGEQDVSQAPTNSWCSRPDIGLTKTGAPFVAWDFIRMYPDGTGLTKARKIYSSQKTDLGNIYGAYFNGSAWKALGGQTLVYDDDSAVGKITNKGKWDVAVSPRVTRFDATGDEHPVVAFLHTEVDQDVAYRAIPKTHVLKYDDSRAGWAGLGVSDDPGGVCTDLDALTVCSRPAITALPNGKLAIVWTRTGPDLSVNTNLPVVQVTGKVFLNDEQDTWSDYEDAWTDLSASLFDFASTAAIATNDSGNPVVTWVDAGINVFVLEWDMGSETWQLLGLSYWMPSEINGEVGLQGGPDIAIGDDGQPVIAWSSAPISEELKALIPTLSENVEGITEEMIAQITAALDTATFDIMVRAFNAGSAGQDLSDVIKEVQIIIGESVFRQGVDPEGFADTMVTTDAAVAAVTVTTPTNTILVLESWDDGSREDKEWEYECDEGGVESKYAEFTAGTYTVRALSLSGAVLATTTVDFSSDLPQPTATPALTTPSPAPGSSDPFVLVAGPDTTFEWDSWTADVQNPPSDPDGTSNVVFSLYSKLGGDDLEVGPRTVDVDDAAGNSYTPPSPLVPGVYEAELDFAEGNMWTDDGVSYIVARTRGIEYTVIISDAPNNPDKILGVSLERGMVATNESRGTMYEFRAEITTTTDVTTVTLVSPEGQHVWFSNSWNDGPNLSWEYETDGGAELLENFGQGVYAIKVTYPTVRGTEDSFTTHAVFGNADYSPLPMPDATPTITSPADGGVVTSPFELVWDAWDPADPAYAADSEPDVDVTIWTGAYSMPDDEEITEDFSLKTATRHEFEFPDGAYLMELAFAVIRTAANDDGIDVEAINWTAAEVDVVLAGNDTIHSEDWDVDGAEWQYVNGTFTETSLPYTTTNGDDGAGDGYVSATMASLGDLGPGLGEVVSIYWPCFLAPDKTEWANGDFTDATISLALKPSADLDLKNGSVRFFVGEYDGSRGTGRFWYTDVSSAFTIGAADQWTTSTVDLAAAGWENAGTTDVSLDQLLDHPERWGFMIVGASSQPAGTLDFDSVVASAEGFVITLLPNYNLVSLPYHTILNVGEIFNPQGRASIKAGLLYRWDTDLKDYAEVNDTATLSPQVGCWVESPAGGTTRPIHGALASGVLDLKAGWNLVGPVRETPKPHDDSICPTQWRWNATRQAYNRVRENETLIPGNAYWIYAKEDIDDFVLELQWEVDPVNWAPEEQDFV